MYGRARDDDAGRAQDALAERVALLQHVDDVAFLLVRGLREQRLVDVRVELSFRLDLLQPLALEQLLERAMDEANTLLELRLLVVDGGDERALEIVEYGQ